MENEDIYKLARTLSDNIVRGKGKKVANLIKDFVNMDIGIMIRVVENDQNRAYENNEANYQVPLTYQEILDQLINWGYDREKSEKSAKNSDTLENAINYYLSLQ